MLSCLKRSIQINHDKSAAPHHASSRLFKGWKTQTRWGSPATQRGLTWMAFCLRVLEVSCWAHQSHGSGPLGFVNFQRCRWDAEGRYALARKDMPGDHQLGDFRSQVQPWGPMAPRWTTPLQLTPATTHQPGPGYRRCQVRSSENQQPKTMA